MGQLKSIPREYQYKNLKKTRDGLCSEDKRVQVVDGYLFVNGKEVSMIRSELEYRVALLKALRNADAN